MKKKVITLSCIAAVAIATFVGTKTLQSNAYEASGLLSQNVEALSQSDAGDGGEGSGGYNICYYESKVKKGCTYYNCGSCKQVYDETGTKGYSKCFY